MYFVDPHEYRHEHRQKFNMAGLRECFEGQAITANDGPRYWLVAHSVRKEYQDRLLWYAKNEPARISLTIYRKYVGGELHIPHV